MCIRDRYGTSRSVEFLYSQKSNSNVSGQELRFAGNDITTIKKAELEDFLKAGYPIVAVPYLYDTDSCLLYTSCKTEGNA